MTDTTTPSFPHGTPSGFDAGCRSAACSGAYLSGITCRDAKRRYVGDWTFRRRVDAGMTPGEVVQAEADEVEAERVARVAATAAALAAAKADAKAAKRAEKKTRARAKTTRRKIGVYAADGTIHGSLTGQRNGCRNPDLCPGPSLGVMTCSDAARIARREHSQAWRDRHGGKRRPKTTHGTPSGYQTFKCRSRTDCPAIAEGGISCGQAKYEYEKAREARKAA